MPTGIKIEGEEYMTAQEAAARLGVKPATLYAYTSRGRLRSFRQGIRRRSLYRQRDVDVLLRFGPSVGGRPTARLPRAEEWIPYTG